MGVSQPQVTNDAAERAVKNAQEVSFSAQSIQQREEAMIVMNKHRSMVNYKTKKDFL